MSKSGRARDSRKTCAKQIDSEPRSDSRIRDPSSILDPVEISSTISDNIEVKERDLVSSNLLIWPPQSLMIAS